GAESETGKIPEYSKADNPIEANIGTDFIITLESNRTTGYEWQLAKPLDKTIVDFVSSEYIKGSSDLIGSGGREMWRFKTVGLGKSTISFQYIRPLEKDTPPAANKDFIVIVKKDTGK
ncbi:MAG: protease inhibitor I42 family protein, partial [Candidatus Omnitrophota bacterium]|nr:protease inhibitor I42 family protein [Candidatus Omnitrophota bacterium]